MGLPLCSLPLSWACCFSVRPASEAARVQKFKFAFAIDSYRKRLAFLHCLSHLDVEKKETEYREYPQRAALSPRKIPVNERMAARRPEIRGYANLVDKICQSFGTYTEETDHESTIQL